MKVILTERQYNKIFLLKESNDILTNYNQTISEVSKKLDTTFSKVTFISIAEIPKHISELKQHQNQLSSYNDVIKSEYDKISYFLNNQISQEDFDANWSDIDLKVDNAYQSARSKINNLSEIIDTLVSLGESDAFKAFAEVKPISI